MVSPAKVRDYLLASCHPDNAGKAAFFLRFGFQPERWPELQFALAIHPRSNLVVRATAAGEGTRYRAQGSLNSPDGRNPCIVTIWATEHGMAPRLVTAFPGPSPIGTA